VAWMTMVLQLSSSLFGSDVTWPVSGGRGRVPLLILFRTASVLITCSSGTVSCFLVLIRTCNRLLHSGLAIPL
jgi:hypothetical protein